MPQQRSRTRAVIPGKMILGKDKAQEAQRKSLGGAVVPGRMILGDSASVEQKKAVDAKAVVVKADVKAETGKSAPRQSRIAGEKPDGTKGKPAPVAAPAKPAFSENEADAMLTADPNAWDKVLDLEVDRDEGRIRVAVARAIIAAADKATENPVPKAALESLQALVGKDAGTEQTQA